MIFHRKDEGNPTGSVHRQPLNDTKWRVPEEQPSKLDIIPIDHTIQLRARRCHITDGETRSSEGNANPQAPQKSKSFIKSTIL